MMFSAFCGRRKIAGSGVLGFLCHLTGILVTV